MPIKCVELACMKCSIICLISPFYSSFLSQRVNQCLRNACHASEIPHDLCMRFIDCGFGRIFTSQPAWDNWKNNGRANACFDEDGFSYGIYTKAVKLTTADTVTSYVYSLFWGFQVPHMLSYNVCIGDMIDCLYTQYISICTLHLTKC